MSKVLDGSIWRSYTKSIKIATKNNRTTFNSTKAIIKYEIEGSNFITENKSINDIRVAVLLQLEFMPDLSVYWFLELLNNFFD